MDKQPDSMATINMKPEYAASEVYSTTSEAPPAYIKQHSNSVKIAKIIALTVIASSFIIGSFILASAYLQARSSCDQMQTFDSILEKELMLEALQQSLQELPKAEALMQAKENQDIDDLQKLETDTLNKKSIDQPKDVTTNSDTDSSFSDNEEVDDSARVHIRLPLELDISDLANALLENNQKSRMNCVIERRHAEEFVDAPAKTMQLPFGLNITTEQKKQRVTGERMAIFCESGNDEKNQMDQVEQIPPFMMPVHRYPIPYGATPQHNPMTHMPQQMGPPPPPPQQQQQHQMMYQNNDESPAIQFPGHFMIRQMALPLSQIQQQLQPQQRSMLPPPQMSMRPPMMHQMNMQQHHQQQQQQQQQPPVPDQIMQAPRPEQPEIRIQLQRIPFPINSNELSDTPVQIQLQEIPIRQMRLPQQQQQQQQHQHQQEPVQVQRIPLAVALQRAGITPEDLQNIQRMAEARIQQELRQLAEEELSNSSNDSGSSSSSSSDSSEDDDSQSLDDSQQEQQQQDDKIMQIGRSAFGRSLVTPVRIPVNLMQQITQEQEEVLPQDRPHFVQPRSVRSAEDVLKGEKRVKRCACNCDC